MQATFPKARIPRPAHDHFHHDSPARSAARPAGAGCRYRGEPTCDQTRDQKRTKPRRAGIPGPTRSDLDDGGEPPPSPARRPPIRTAPSRSSHHPVPVAEPSRLQPWCRPGGGGTTPLDGTKVPSARGGVFRGQSLSGLPAPREKVAPATRRIDAPEREDHKGGGDRRAGCLRGSSGRRTARMCHRRPGQRGELPSRRIQNTNTEIEAGANSLVNLVLPTGTPRVTASGDRTAIGHEKTHAGDA